MTKTTDSARFRELEERVLAQIDQEEVIAFHRSLVQERTVNPPGDVREAFAICEETVRKDGFATKQVGDHDLMPNLVAIWGDAGGPTLCFNSHYDVVPTGEESAWNHDPWAAGIVEGRIYGRGAGDAKASVAAQVMAGIAVARAGIPVRGALVVNEVADEEVGGVHGAELIVREGHVRPDWVIIGEQTGNRVAVGEKGAAGTEVMLHGRTAHGALPWEGANAIEAMAEVIVALRRELWPQLGNRTHEFFHPSSASVNLLEGGVKANVVPDHASFFIDRRIVPGEQPEECVAEIRRIAEAAVAEMPGIRVEVRPAGKGWESNPVSVQDPLVQSMVGANARLGLSTEPTGFSMGTDGRFFAAAGYPTIIYGPGDPATAHVPDEWVGIDEIMDATRAYAIAAVRLIGKHEEEKG
ncbi:MAG TPA: M20 family metallopeptidase [Thermomicrobiales bacterium]|nr:M20 family metallopeptidase [Thermomicrobiales bacterium]